jgi:hypothetical protein
MLPAALRSFLRPMNNLISTRIARRRYFFQPNFQPSRFTIVYASRLHAPKFATLIWMQQPTRFGILKQLTRARLARINETTFKRHAFSNSSARFMRT